MCLFHTPQPPLLRILAPNGFAAVCSEERDDDICVVLQRHIRDLVTTHGLNKVHQGQCDVLTRTMRSHHQHIDSRDHRAICKTHVRQYSSDGVSVTAVVCEQHTDDFRRQRLFCQFK